LVVPSNSGGCSAVASNDGGNFSGTLLSKLQIQNTKQKNRERSIKQQNTSWRIERKQATASYAAAAMAVTVRGACAWPFFKGAKERWFGTESCLDTKCSGLGLYSRLWPEQWRKGYMIRWP